MKKTLLTIVTLASASIFADQHIDIQTPTFVVPEIVKDSFFYVKFAAGEHDIARAEKLSVLPGLGLGYRRLTNHGAADISVNGNGYSYEHKKENYFWTAPKASYLHYFSPHASQTAYVGAGLAWGGLKTGENKFVGIIPSATAGYEFARTDSILGFGELTVSQPALALAHTGIFPTPVAEFSMGVGF